MKNQVSDPFSENRKSFSWGMLLTAVCALGCAGWLGWAVFSDVSVPQVRVVQPVQVGSAK
ncbi:MAG: hypothetical protein H6862_05990 [Rhodospirillales bacterium]|nr:hypothetical protein [Rhodospirillales bacterium]